MVANRGLSIVHKSRALLLVAKALPTHDTLTKPRRAFRPLSLQQMQKESSYTYVMENRLEFNR